MADRWAVASGNWSSTATWNGGTLPTAADDVYADGYTVTIDQNVTVLSIRTTQRTGGTAGGGFTSSTSGLILNFTGTGILAGSTVCLTLAANTTLNSNITGSSTVNNAHGLLVNSGTITLTGNVSPGTVASGNSQGWGISVTGTSTLNMIGNVVGTSGNNSIGITGGSSSTINITGNVTASATDNGSGHGVSISGTINVTGTVTGGSSGLTGGNACGIIITGSSPATITGNCFGAPTGTLNAGNGGNTNGPHGVQHAGTGVCTINGNCTGGITGRAFGASNQSSGTLVINGNVTGGSATLCFGVVNFGSGTLTVNGNSYGSSNSSGFYSFGSGLCILNGNGFTVSGAGTGFAPIRGLIHATNNMELQYRVNNAGVPGVARSLYTGGQDLGQPSGIHVRAGQTFGVSNEFVGTLIVPSAQFVSLGTPVDSGVGTLQHLTLADLQVALSPNSSMIAQRSDDDTKALTFSWPVSGVVVSGQKSIDNGAYSSLSGTISFLRTEGSRHYYTLGYNAADRSTQESTIRYKLMDNTYTKFFTLRIMPSTNAEVVAIKAKTDNLPPDPASSGQIAGLTTQVANSFVSSSGQIAGLSNQLTNSSTSSSGQIVGLSNQVTSSFAASSGQITSLSNQVTNSSTLSSGQITGLSNQVTSSFAGVSGQLETRTLPSSVYFTSGGDVNVASLSSGAVQDIFSTYPLQESYAPSGSLATPAQIMYFIQQTFSEFAISGVNISVKKLDGTTTAAEFILDDEKKPQSRSRIL